MGFAHSRNIERLAIAFFGKSLLTNIADGGKSAYAQAPLRSTACGQTTSSSLKSAAAPSGRLMPTASSLRRRRSRSTASSGHCTTASSTPCRIWIICCPTGR